LLISRQGKVRLSKWYSTMSNKERAKAIRDACSIAIGRSVRLTNFVEHQGQRLICRRYASLHFVACIDKEDNELLALEIIHHFVETLDRYFDNVCELDLIFNFHRAFYILDEILLAGELQESSKKTILKLVANQEALVEEQGKALE
jgi:AP-1 complex subunit sigma 1/2